MSRGSFRLYVGRIFFFFFTYYRLEAVQFSEQSVLHPDIEKDLTSLEKELVKTMEMIIVHGKRGSCLPSNIPPDVKPALEYLADPDNRKTAGVNSITDPYRQHYLFANTDIAFFI